YGRWRRRRRHGHRRRLPILQRRDPRFEVHHLPQLQTDLQRSPAPPRVGRPPGRQTSAGPAASAPPRSRPPKAPRKCGPPCRPAREVTDCPAGATSAPRDHPNRRRIMAKTTKTETAKAPKAKKAAKAKPAKVKKASALDAAARVLGEAKEPMTTPAMIEAMAA